MCGILGIVAENIESKKIIEALKLIENRGSDSIGIHDGKTIKYYKKISEINLPKKSNLLIIHLLHSTTGFLKQPLQIEENLIVFNGTVFNWKEICKKENIEAKNDTELLLKHIMKRGITSEEKISKALDELNADYALALVTKNYIYLARDKLGIKPMWVAKSRKSFGFASERKVLLKLGFKMNEIRELHPRHIISFNIKTKEIKDYYRGFFEINKEDISFEEAKEKIKKALFKAVELRKSDRKLGILLSGGIDSTLLALIAKKAGIEFSCYCAATDENSIDLKMAKRVSKELGFKLNYKILGQTEIEEYLKKIVPRIEDSSTVKVSVALPIYTACELAKEDEVKVMLTGSGSDELFCGYERHQHGLDLTKETYYELLRFFERNSYRDDCIAMANKIELRYPYLDKELIEIALKMKDEYKINKDNGKYLNKYILREIAKEEGLSEEIAYRKKTAAQYGSGFDQIIEKIAKKKKMAKPQYLQQFLNHKNLRIGALVSSGKDSLFALNIIEQQNYEVSCLINIKSKNKDSFMFHTVNSDLVKLQAKAMDKPLIEFESMGEKEIELEDLKAAIKKAINKYNIEGIVCGAIHSNYQRERVEKIADSLGLKTFAPLWHIHEESMLNALIRNKFDVIITKTAALGLENLVGKKIDYNLIETLKKIKEKYKISLVGEGGEYESFVLDAPMFNKKINITKSKIIKDGLVSQLIIEKAELIDKIRTQ